MQIGIQNIKIPKKNREDAVIIAYTYALQGCILSLIELNSATVETVHCTQTSQQTKLHAFYHNSTISGVHLHQTGENTWSQPPKLLCRFLKFLQ